MRIAMHGGMCCGIKTIFSLGTHPSARVGPTVKSAPKNHDANGGDVSSKLDFFTDEAPEETREERLDRFLAFLKKRRPQGIVEIALAFRPEYDWIDQSRWVKVIEARGFKESVRGKNSNSGNVVAVYHLVMTGE